MEMEIKVEGSLIRFTRMDRDGVGNRGRATPQTCTVVAPRHHLCLQKQLTV